MKSVIGLSLFTLTFSTGMAHAQSASETTTTQQTTMAPPPIAPAPGTLSTTKESHASDGYGNSTDQKATSYRSGDGVANDSSTTTRNVAPLPPAVSTTTNSSTTTTQPN